MDKSLERRIRERAYEIWNTTGRQPGQADQHWLMAELEVLTTLMAEQVAPQPGAARRPRSRATPTVATPQLRAMTH